MIAQPDHHVLGPALESQPGSAYDEKAFLYFLALEQARADHANHALRLVLVSLEAVPGRPATVDASTATRLFAGLKLSLRDTDIMGWYRQHHVAGAVLAERPDAPGDAVSQIIQRRVTDEVRRRLPSRVGADLRVRAIHLRPRPAAV